jgi:hypothetical protein
MRLQGGASANRSWLACAALLWVGCSAVYFLTSPGRIDMFDGGIRHDVTESLIDIGVPAVRDPWFPGLPGRGGYRYAWYELGSSVAAIPFVLLGGRLGHRSLEAKQFAFSMTSVPFAAGAVALVFLIYGRLGLSIRRALSWSLVVAFGTLLWPYAGSSFDAALQAFWLTLAIWAIVEALTSSSKAWAVVSGAAFAVLVNVQEAYVVLGGSMLAVYPFTIAALRKRLSRSVIYVAGAGLTVGVLLIFAANAYRYGNPLETGRVVTGGEIPVLGDPLIGLFGLAFSPAKSILLYSPTVILGLIGLRRLVTGDPERFMPIPACLAIHLALVSSLRFWAGEWAWGPRYLVATVPLVSLGLPFAWPEGEKRQLKWLICGAALTVQLLAISVDHQRYYFERSFEPFFWRDESRMYTDSPLAARAGELATILKGKEWRQAHALVPGPRPFSMTSSIFGPGPGQPPPEWMRNYLVFLVPRPWTLWGWYVPTYERPGPIGLMTMAGAVVALASVGALFALVGREPSAVPHSQETQEKAR